LVQQMRHSFPQHRVLVSTTTDTGQELARKRFGAENVFYFPMDFAFAIGPYLRALKPELVVLVETEFWPNFLKLAHASGARIAVVNARISDRSWPRYRRFHWALRKMLGPILPAPSGSALLSALLSLEPCLASCTAHNSDGPGALWAS